LKCDIEIIRKKVEDNQLNLIKLMTHNFSKSINMDEEGTIGSKAPKNMKNCGRISSRLKSLEKDDLNEFR